MATYKLLQNWVASGPSPDVLPAGTLVGDGTPYPVDMRALPKKGSGVMVEVPTPKVQEPKPQDDKGPHPTRTADHGASPGGDPTPGYPKSGALPVGAPVKPQTREELDAATKAADESSWGDACRVGTEAAFDMYLRDFPNGAHKGEVSAKKNEAKKAAKEAPATTPARPGGVDNKDPVGPPNETQYPKG